MFLKKLLSKIKKEGPKEDWKDWLTNGGDIEIEYDSTGNRILLGEEDGEYEEDLDEEIDEEEDENDYLFVSRICTETKLFEKRYLSSVQSFNFEEDGTTGKVKGSLTVLVTKNFDSIPIRGADLLKVEFLHNEEVFKTITFERVKVKKVQCSLESCEQFFPLSLEWEANNAKYHG